MPPVGGWVTVFLTHMFAFWRLEAAGVIGPHDPRVLRLELEDLEVRVALLQSHASPVPLTGRRRVKCTHVYVLYSTYWLQHSLSVFGYAGLELRGTPDWTEASDSAEWGDHADTLEGTWGWRRRRRRRRRSGLWGLLRLLRGLRLPDDVGSGAGEPRGGPHGQRPHEELASLARLAGQCCKLYILGTLYRRECSHHNFFFAFLHIQEVNLVVLLLLRCLHLSLGCLHLPLLKTKRFINNVLHAT